MGDYQYIGWGFEDVFLKIWRPLNDLHIYTAVYICIYIYIYTSLEFVGLFMADLQSLLVFSPGHPESIFSVKATVSQQPLQTIARMEVKKKANPRRKVPKRNSSGGWGCGILFLVKLARNRKHDEFSPPNARNFRKV